MGELWTIDRGIGCQVGALINGWLYTLCKTFGPGDMTTELPRRICKKCNAARTALAAAQHRREETAE